LKKKQEVREFNQIVLFREEGGKYQIALNKDSDSIWLNLNQLVDLYQTTKQNINLHIHKILAEGELDTDSTVKYT
jgi:hypothetical protein